MVPDSDPVWKEIEKAQIPKGNLRDFLMTIHHNVSLDHKLSTPILASIRAWVHLRKYQKRSEKMSPLKPPISAIEHIIPDRNFKSWMGKGITYLEDILNGTEIKKNNILQREYQLPLQEQYKYFQIVHLLKNNSQISTLFPEKITQFYQQNPPVNKGISIIYSNLQEKDICTKSQSMLAWEQELGVEYPTQQWEKHFTSYTIPQRAQIYGKCNRN